MRSSTVSLSIALAASLAMSGWLWTKLERERQRQHVGVVAGVIVAPAKPPPHQIPAVRDESSTPTPAIRKRGVDPAMEAKLRAAEQADESRMQRHLRDPRFLQAYREKRRSQLNDRRDAMIRLLRFTPQDADAVVELLVDFQVRTVNRPTTVFEGTPENMRRIKEEEDAEERAYQDQVRARIGEVKRARLANYLDTVLSRRRVDDLRLELSGADALRDDQVEPLIEALHTESAQYESDLDELLGTMSTEGSSPDGSRRYRDRKLELLKDYQRRTHAAAANILSEEQLHRLDESMQRLLERERAAQHFAQIEDQLDAAEGAPGP